MSVVEEGYLQSQIGVNTHGQQSGRGSVIANKYLNLPQSFVVERSKNSLIIPVVFGAHNSSRIILYSLIFQFVHTSQLQQQRCLNTGSVLHLNSLTGNEF